MLTTLVALTPVAAGFATGHVLRPGGLAGGQEGSFLFLLNLYVCMPALLLRALLEVELRRRWRGLVSSARREGDHGADQLPRRHRSDSNAPRP